MVVFGSFSSIHDIVPTFSFAAGACAAMRFLICAAIVKNACSTFVEFFADVSRNGISVFDAANSLASYDGDNQRKT